MNLISFKGPYFVVGFLLVSSPLVWLYLKGHIRETLFGLICLMSYVLSVILKVIFQQPRPQNTDEYFFLDYYSFPSSHVLFYTAVFGYYLFLTYRISHIDKIIKFNMRLLFWYLIATVGISRVFLGHHWFKDVFIGYFIGATYLQLVIYFYFRSKKTQTKD